MASSTSTSWRRDLCSSSITCAINFLLAAMKAKGVCHCASTSASRINICRASTGSALANGTRRPLYTTKPYKVARSKATTSPCRASQCGSSNCFFSRCEPTCSSHVGSIFAMPRPNKRVVSTNSAQTSHLPGFLRKCTPGWRWNLMPRAPR